MKPSDAARAAATHLVDSGRIAAGFTVDEVARVIDAYCRPAMAVASDRVMTRQQLHDAARRAVVGITSETEVLRLGLGPDAELDAASLISQLEMAFEPLVILEGGVAYFNPKSDGAGGAPGGATVSS